jgi:DnaA family protein
MEQLPLNLAPPPEPTLDNYVPGENADALTTLRGLIDGSGVERWVYLWGPPGSGRTHLLRATAAAAARKGRTVHWFGQDASRPADERFMLLVDDAHRLDPAAQMAAFDLINETRQAGGCLLASGRRLARDLALRDDLRTRFAQCLNLPLAALSETQARAALESQARSLGFAMDPELVAYLMSRAPRDMSTLMAILGAIDRRSLSLHRPLTIPLLREVMRDLIAEPEPKAP